MKVKLLSPSGLKTGLILFKAQWLVPSSHCYDPWTIDQYEAEELRLSDIISGFVNPDEEDMGPSATHIGSELSDEDLDDEDDDDDDDDDDTDSSDDDDGNKGPDPEEARERFTQLRNAYERRWKPSTTKAVITHNLFVLCSKSVKSSNLI